MTMLYYGKDHIVAKRFCLRDVWEKEFGFTICDNLPVLLFHHGRIMYPCSLIA